MRHLSEPELDRWLQEQGWLVRDVVRSHFQLLSRTAFCEYQCEIAEDSASAGCGMASEFLHDYAGQEFPGALFHVSFQPRDSEEMFIADHVLRAGSIIRPSSTYRMPLLLHQDEYESCAALLSLALMFGWRSSLVISGRHYLVTTDDEPLPAIVTDSLSSYMERVIQNLEFKRTDLSVDRRWY